MPYHLSNNITKSVELKEVNAQLKHGNHQSCLMNKKKLLNDLTRSVSLGYAILLPADKINNIPGIMIQPDGILQTFTLIPDGTQARKPRLTHNLLFSLMGNNFNLNDRVDMTKYSELIYGWCLQQVIHFIFVLCLNHPGRVIFIVKDNLSDAYRRLVHALNTTKQSIIFLNNIAYMFLWLTFGKAPNPDAWCTISEIISDLSNKVPLIQEWDHTK